MSTSVIVLSYNPGGWLKACLEAAVNQADQVVIVDNGSPGASASGIGREAGALVVRSEENLGYAAGVNLGVQSASGDLIALLNDDALPGPGWLAAAGRALERPDVAAVVPKVLRSGWYREIVLHDCYQDAPGDHRVLGRKVESLTSDGQDVLDRLLGAGIHRLERSCVGGERWRWTRPGVPFYAPVAGPDGGELLIDGESAPAGRVCRLLNKAGGYLLEDGVLGDIGDETPDDGRWDQPSEPFYGSGTALVIRRDTWERVGELAGPFFAYYEDGDWCWRARLAGMRILYDPSATVEHRHSATSGGASPRVDRLASRNRLLTLARNAPLRVLPSAMRRVGRELPDRGGRGDASAKLAWALSSRRGLRRRWEISPLEVWNRWAAEAPPGDDGPALA